MSVSISQPNGVTAPIHQYIPHNSLYLGGQSQAMPAVYQSFQHPIATQMVRIPTYAWQMTEAEINSIRNDLEAQVHGRSANPSSHSCDAA